MPLPYKDGVAMPGRRGRTRRGGCHIRQAGHLLLRQLVRADDGLHARARAERSGDVLSELDGVSAACIRRGDALTVVRVGPARRSRRAGAWGTWRSWRGQAREVGGLIHGVKSKSRE